MHHPYPKQWTTISTYVLQIISLKIQSLKQHGLIYIINAGQMIVCKAEMLQIRKVG